MKDFKSLMAQLDSRMLHLRLNLGCHKFRKYPIVSFKIDIMLIGVGALGVSSTVETNPTKIVDRIKL